MGRGALGVRPRECASRSMANPAGLHNRRVARHQLGVFVFPANVGGLGTRGGRTTRLTGKKGLLWT